MSIESEMLSMLSDSRGLLSDGVFEHISDLIRSGECAVALEELCSYLVEEGAHPTRELVARIASLGPTLKVRASYWEHLLEAE